MPGDWNGDGITDLGAVAPNGVWLRGLNGDFAFINPSNEALGWATPGSTPIVADWNGDGTDDIGAYSNGFWFLDLNGNGLFDPMLESQSWGIPGWRPTPGLWK